MPRSVVKHKTDFDKYLPLEVELADIVEHVVSYFGVWRCCSAALVFVARNIRPDGDQIR